MPIYAYACDACGHQLEALQKISDQPLTECPECGQRALKKQLTAPAFRLKGSGWYETDFKTGDKKKNLHGGKSSSEKAPDAPKAKSEGKDKKSDTSKTATKSSTSGSSSSAST